MVCLKEFINKEQTHGGDPARDENGSKSNGLLIAAWYKQIREEFINKEQTHGGDPAGDEYGSKSNSLLIAIWNKLMGEGTLPDTISL